ncbi:MAG: SDR family oxidoreductase [Prochloraceae cyanobacterium]
MNDKFTGKNIIITGGSSGIGKACGKKFASLGANITIVARDENKLSIAKKEIEKNSQNKTQKIVDLVADVSDRSQIEKAIELSVNKIGDPDILITSAGIAVPGYFQQQSLEIFERSMAINYFGSLYAIKAVLPFMINKKQGHIVLISSGAGAIGIYGYTTYSPTKFALTGLAECLRSELKPFKINVSIVYPPDTDTPQLQAENKTKPAATKMIAGTAKLWSAENVAKIIVEGIENNYFKIAPGLEMTLLLKLNSFLKPILNWYFDRIVAKNFENKP